MIKATDVHWFPMRVTYGRELIVKEFLDKENIENFLPMHYAIVDTKEGPQRKAVPAVTNLIFIRSTQEQLTRLKMYDKRFAPLRYMIRKSDIDNEQEILTVSDKSMDNFLKVAQLPNDNVFYLDINDHVLSNIGKRVLITAGPFVGVEGIVKRIKRNKHVVIQLDDILAAAITENIASRRYVRIEILTPAINQGYVMWAYPDSPRHPKQRYYLSEKGLRLAEK